jgi:HK97 family phage portal protein
MTTADFLEKVCYNLLVKNNSYILPVWEGSELVALYPLSPSEVKFVQDLSNTLFIDFSFANGYSSRVRYSDVIHIRYNLGPSEFLGGDVNGEPDIKALQRGVNLNEALLDSVQKSVHSNVNGYLKYNTYIDEGEAAKALKEFTSQLNNNENGIMLLDQKLEFVPLQKETKLVDNDTLKFVDEKVLRNYGISPKIVSGDFTKEDYESFFQKVLEPIIVSMEQAFTKGLFTREGRTKYGHKITLYTSALNFMTMTEKKEIGTLLSNTGACNTDELRNMFGYAPCEDRELGKMYIQSKNFGSAEFVSQQVKLETDALKELAKTK